MKKILTGLALITLIVFQSCLKNDQNVDFSGLKMITQILWPPVASASAADATGSGLSYFGAGALTTLNPDDEIDTVYFIVNLAGTNSTMSKDLPITVAVDNSKLLDNFSSDSITYESMPDSVYKILNATSVIPAGSRLDTVYVAFYPGKIDPSKNYGLPITITNAPGTTISSNFGTLYLHTIGNPLAGAYLHDFFRYNGQPDTLTGTYSGSQSYTDDPIIASPSNPTTIGLPEGYLGANGIGGIQLTFTNNNGVLSDFAVSLDAASVAGIPAVGFTVVSGPTLVGYQIVGDASTGYKGSTFRVYFDILNSGGADRKTINVYTKQ